MTTRKSDELGESFLEASRPVPTSAVGRLLRSGRTALGLGGAAFRPAGEVDLDVVARLTGQLGELKGLAMKAGQTLSFLDAGMAPEVRALLAVLQTKAPASEWSAVERTVRDALGDRAGALLAGLEPRPVAVASIGQVHRGLLADGRAVAVKVRHPGIEEAVRADFTTARAGLGFANTLLLGAAGGAREAMEEARRALLGECDFRLEAAAQRRFGALYAGDPVLRVPAVVEGYDSASVLVTEWLPGRPLEAWLDEDPSQAERDRAGEALLRFYLGTLYRTGYFHADPHPGNYAMRDDGALVVYDYGCVCAFAPAHVRALADLVAALREDRREALRDAAVRLGFPAFRGDEDFAVFRTFARGFFAPMLARGPSRVAPDASIDAREVARDKRKLARLGMPAHLLFLLRIRFGLYAVLARLGACLDWGALESAWAAQVAPGPDGAE